MCRLNGSRAASEAVLAGERYATDLEGGMDGAVVVGQLGMN